MPCNHQLPAPSDRLPSGLSGAWLFARWLMVMVMVVAQVGAPFHHHHHDGVGVQLELGASHDLQGDAETRADSERHHGGAHCAIAIRVDRSRVGKLPAVDFADAAIAVHASLPLFAALDTPAPVEWGRYTTTPDFRSYRSLPPAGRAPPLYA
jgi:hypothetical protein